MRLHYITVQPTVGDVQRELQHMEKFFLEKSSCQPLAEYERQLHGCIKTGDWDRAHALCEEIVDASKSWNSVALPWTQRLGVLIDTEVRRLEKEEPRIRVRAIYKCIKEVRQEYWLSWLEDFFCEKIESAFQICMRRPTDGQEHLYCVALPEFSFADSGNVVSKYYGLGSGSRAFYKSVVTEFLQGRLPKDIPRTPSGMKTLLALTDQADGYAHRQVILFAGTIIGRNREQQDNGNSPYYNMAPVFTRGRCMGVWEKQEISGIDGKSNKDKHRHVTWSQMPEQNRTYTASVFSQEELQAVGMQELSPVFEIPVFERGLALRFALCICLDYSKPEIIGCKPAEIYVLISCGMKIEYHIQQVGETVEVFLFCDGGGRDKKGQACIQLGDPHYWPGKEEEDCTWRNIDTGILATNSYREAYAKPGVYIDPNVLKWNPGRLQL